MLRVFLFWHKSYLDNAFFLNYNFFMFLFQVAKYKRLKGGIEFVDSIPKSAAGKILRKDIKAEYDKKFAVMQN